MRKTALLLFLVLCGCQETLMHDLDESGANQVVLALSGAGIQSRKIREGDGWSVRVPSRSSNKALLSLEKTRTFSKLKWKPQAFKTSLVSGREERKAMIEARKTTRLEESIKSFPSVLEAYVHLYKNEVSGSLFKNKLPSSSASVLVISDEPDTVDAIQIKKLIAGASGIGTKNIQVIVERAFIPRKIGKPKKESSRQMEQSSLLSERLREYFSGLKPLQVSIIVASILLLIWLLRNGREMQGRHASYEKKKERMDTLNQKSRVEKKLGPWDIFRKEDEKNETINQT